MEKPNTGHDFMFVHILELHHQCKTCKKKCPTASDGHPLKTKTLQSMSFSASSECPSCRVQFKVFCDYFQVTESDLRLLVLAR